MAKAYNKSLINMRSVGSMKRLRYVELAIFLCLSLTFIQSVSAYDSGQYEFSITPPSGWQVEENPSEMVVVAFVDPSLTSGASINIVVKEGVEASMEDWTNADTEYITTYLSSIFDNFQLLFNGQRIVNGVNGYEFICTTSINGVEMKMEQVIFTGNGKMYVITCTALSSEYSSKVVDFTQCIESFKINSLASASPNSNITNSSDSGYGLIIGLIVLIVVLLVVSIIVVLKREKMATNNSNYPINNNQQTTPPPPKYNQPNISIETKQVDTPNFCRYCGKTTKTDTVFCESCGKRLTD
jgi:hypothetical protein